jgi:hypothetical protein
LAGVGLNELRRKQADALDQPIDSNILFERIRLSKIVIPISAVRPIWPFPEIGQEKDGKIENGSIDVIGQYHLKRHIPPPH